MFGLTYFHSFFPFVHKWLINNMFIHYVHSDNKVKCILIYLNGVQRLFFMHLVLNLLLNNVDDDDYNDDDDNDNWARKQ